MTMGTMQKQMCSGFIYSVLSNENPTEYPKMTDGPAGPNSGNMTFSSSGGSCTIEEEGFSMTLPNCDCSDPKKYVFYDEGRF